VTTTNTCDTVPFKDIYLHVNTPTDETDRLAAPSVDKQSQAEDVDSLAAAAAAVSVEMLKQDMLADEPAVGKIKLDSTGSPKSHVAENHISQEQILSKESARLFAKRELVAAFDGISNTSNKKPMLVAMPSSSSGALQLDYDEEMFPDELSI